MVFIVSGLFCNFFNLPGRDDFHVVPLQSRSLGRRGSHPCQVYSNASSRMLIRACLRLGRWSGWRFQITTGEILIEFKTFLRISLGLGEKAFRILRLALG